MACDSLSRRDFLTVATLAAASFQTAAAAAVDPEELTVIVYGGSFEKGWRKAVLEPFERANPSIRVRIATGLTMQTVSVMRAQKDDVKIDVIMMDRPGAEIARPEGLYAPLSAGAVSNLQSVIPRFRVDGNPYAIFSYGSEVLAYDKSHIPVPPQSWRDLWRPEYKGHVAIPDITTSHGVSFLIMAARLAGGSERNIDSGFEYIVKLKPNLLTFWTQHAQVAQLLTQGDIWIVPWTNDRAQELQDGGASVDWLVPKEGAVSIEGSIGIAKGTRHLSAAQRYINFVLSEAAQEENARSTYLGPVNGSVHLPAALAHKVESDQATLSKLIDVDWAYVSEVLPQWVARWNREITTP